MEGSKWERWLREAVLYSDRVTRSVDVPKPKTDVQLEHEQFNRLTAALENSGFVFKSMRKEPENEYAHPSSLPTSYFYSYAFEGGKALAMFGSKGYMFNGLYILKEHRGKGLLESIFKTVFSAADSTSSTLYLFPRRYELDLNKEPTDYLKIPRHAYIWKDEENDKLFARYQAVENRLQTCWHRGHKNLVFRPKR
nr:acetyltransferase (GNAT) domain protein [uncultured bacterium]